MYEDPWMYDRSGCLEALGSSCGGLSPFCHNREPFWARSRLDHVSRRVLKDGSVGARGNSIAIPRPRALSGRSIRATSRGSRKILKIFSAYFPFFGNTWQTLSFLSYLSPKTCHTRGPRLTTNIDRSFPGPGPAAPATAGAAPAPSTQTRA